MKDNTMSKERPILRALPKIEARPRSCKCVRGLGLYGAELAIAKDCPVHGENSGYRHVEKFCDGDCE